MLCKSPRLKKTGPGPYDIIVFPCGSCLPCMINYKRIWMHRLELEWARADKNAWITLTYDDENLPEPPDVSESHIKKFRERLQYELLRKATDQINAGEMEEPAARTINGRKIKPPFLTIKEVKKRINNPFTLYGIKVFIVAEYGDKRGRPHYHAIIFGLDGTDRWDRNKRAKSRSEAIREELLENLKSCKDDNAIIRRSWDKGIVEVDIIQSSRGIGYQLGYVTKKVHKAAIRSQGSACWIEDRSIRKNEFVVKSKNIGVEAIEYIARTINPDYKHEWPLRELVYRYQCPKTGVYRTKKKPLGRYLTSKLNLLCGKDRELQVDKAGRRLEMFKYREISGVLDMPQHMSAEGEQKRRSQEFYHKKLRRKESL